MGWRSTTLGELIAFRREEPAEHELLSGNVRVVSKIRFDDGGIELRDRRDTNTKMILAFPGDLLLSGINATKGAIALLPTDSVRLAATIHYSAYEVDTSQVRPDYLWYLLRSPGFKKSLQDQVPGGIKAELKPSRLLPIRLKIPDSLREQEVLVTRASAIDRDFRRFLKRSSGNQARLSGLLGSVLTRLIPSADLGKFGDVITFKPRSGPSFATDPDWHGLPVLMPSAASGFGLDVSKVEYGPGGERVSRKDILEPGDLIIARGNKREQVGNAGIVPAEAKGWVCANLLMRVQVDEPRIDREFCIYWLQTPRMREHVRRAMKGTNPNIQKINQKTILNYPFPTGLSRAEQVAIRIRLDAISSRLARAESTQSSLHERLHRLRPHAIAAALSDRLSWL